MLVNAKSIPYVRYIKSILYIWNLMSTKNIILTLLNFLTRYQNYIYNTHTKFI